MWGCVCICTCVREGVEGRSKIGERHVRFKVYLKCGRYITSSEGK